MFRFCGIELSSPFFLAPLAGITDKTFRFLCREQGAALSYTEMVSAKGLFYQSDASAELMETAEREGPVGVQLFGSDPSMFIYAAGRTNELPCVLVDVNMGCPVPKVVKNGEGSALIKTPELAEKCVRALVEASKKPVTVKTRAGYSDEPGPTEIGPVRFAKLIEDSGASAITVHARTRDQFYHGKADWDIIKAVKKAVTIPVVGNGDVMSAEDGLRMMEYTGCDAVMIARGALGSPWIFRELSAAYEGRPAPAKPEPEEIREYIIRHLELLIEAKGEYTAVREMRKHVSWYVKGLKGAAGIRRAANNARTAEELIRSLK